MSEWDDKRVEELLRQMPKIEDDREPREIYQNIAVKINKRKQKIWIMPAAAALAAVLLFFILVPTLFNGQFSEEKALETADKASLAPEPLMKGKADLSQSEEQHTANKDDPAAFNADQEAEGMSGIGIRAFGMDDPLTAVYEEDIDNMEVLTYAIPDANAMLAVPVSVLVAKEENRSKIDLFNEHMGSLKEEEWGLSDYFPLNANLTLDEENKILTADVPVDHKYGEGSASEQVFHYALSSIMTTFGVDKIKLSTEGNPGIEFGNYGFLKEFIPEEPIGNHAYYLFYPNDSSSKPFIVPYGDKLGSIKEAFLEMKKNRENANLFASIPAEMNFETKENPTERKLTIRLEEGSIINDDESTLHTIEAILLTAKEFEYNAVKLENANIDQVGRFDLDKELIVPVAANKRSIQ